MRIGILTFHRPVNYGAFLQAFSLSARLKAEFPEDEVEIIDYIAPKEARQIKINILRDFKHGGIRAGLQSEKKARIFKKAQNQYLPLSGQSFCKESQQALFAYINSHYDCLVIGSDAVFNWKQTDFPTAFIPNYDFDIPVLTYAASVHGLPFFDMEKEKTDLCGSAFEKMRFVGVRDSTTEAFVKHCTAEVAAHFCCDPTLLIDGRQVERLAGDFAARIQRKYNLSLEKRYIVFMAPDSPLLESIAQKYRGEYSIISLFKNSRYADAFLYDLSPFEWAMVLKGACATVTSYFHGTLLSLVQGTPAVVLDYSGYEDKYQGKLDDLMSRRLSLPEFYFNKQFAISFSADDAFYSLFDNMLNGEYSDKIKTGVQNAKKSFDAFAAEMKSIHEG